MSKLNKVIIGQLLTLLIIAFSSGVYAQHIFSVDYNNLSRENASRLRAQVGVSVTPLTRSAKGEYDVSLSTVQNTKIIILNEETGSNIVITPTKEAPAQFRLQPFFIEELRRSILGNASRYLVMEAGADFSVRNTASLSIQTEEVFIPRYFYGPKENVREALPADRQIVHIFKEKPRLIPAFPNDPENLRYVAQLEEEMSYYVYMYKLPDRTLIIYDEHFNPSIEENGVRTGTNLQFNLSGNLNTQQQAATLHAINLWSAELAGVVPVDIKVEFVSLPSGTLGRSRQQPHYLKSGDSTWYSSALGNQIANYKVSNLSDIKLEMSSNFSWNYSITSPPSGNQYDWLTVMLHEITHGLGFASLIYWDNTLQNNGRYVYTVNDTLAAYTNYPGIFDRQLFQGTSGPNLTSLNQSQRAALVVSNNLFSGRPSSHLLAANGGARVKMYAPFSWRSGSSVSHWDWDNSATPTLMKPFLDPGFRHAVIDAREVAIMQDMGWAVCRPIVNFTNQTVTTNMTVANGCGVVNVQNTTVTPTGTLNIRAERVTIGPGFTVQSGNLTIRVP